MLSLVGRDRRIPNEKQLVIVTVNLRAVEAAAGVALARELLDARDRFGDFVVTPAGLLGGAASFADRAGLDDLPLDLGRLALGAAEAEAGFAGAAFTATPTAVEFRYAPFDGGCVAVNFFTSLSMPVEKTWRRASSACDRGTRPPL